MAKRAYNKHGMTGTKIHEVWKEMKRRCFGLYPGTASYKAKNITVCREWSISSSSFIKWALSHGYKEGLQIDRINNKLGYFPKNCRFVTAKVNANNRENTVYVSYKGVKKSLHDWSQQSGIHRHTLYTRLRRGWSIKNLLTKPIQRKN